jgi:hypothetical protein
MPLISTAQANKASATESNSLQVPAPIQAIQVPDTTYSKVYVDLTWKPRANYLLHAEGSRWSVTYYSQILTKDSALSGLQASASSIYQTYNEIKEMVFRVINPLTTSQDDQTKAMKVSGSSIIAPCVIPNEGDMFLADIGEGKTGVFRVTQTEKKSIFAQSCYEIAYVLDTDTGDKIQALDAKTTNRYYYLSDYLVSGKNPLITTQAYQANVNIAKAYKRMLQAYHDTYYSAEFSTYLIAGQAHSVHDHHHCKHMLRTFDQYELPGLICINKLADGQDPALKASSVWDAITQRDIGLLEAGFTQVELASTRYYAADPQLSPLAYSSIEYIVRGTDTPVRALPMPTIPPGDYSLYTTTAAVTLPWAGSNASVGTAVRGVNLRSLANQTAPVIYPVTQDSHYVFSEHFYNQDANMSVLESLALCHIQSQPIDAQQLHELLLLSQTWDLLERFYYTAVLLSIAKAHLYG